MKTHQVPRRWHSRKKISRFRVWAIGKFCFRLSFIITNNFYYVKCGVWCRTLFRTEFHLWRQLTRIHDLLRLDVESGIRWKPFWHWRSRRLWEQIGRKQITPAWFLGRCHRKKCPTDRKKSYWVLRTIVLKSGRAKKSSHANRDQLRVLLQRRSLLKYNHFFDLRCKKLLIDPGFRGNTFFACSDFNFIVWSAQ